MNEQLGKTLPAPTSILVVSASVLALTLGVTVWMHTQGVEALRAQIHNAHASRPLVKAAGQEPDQPNSKPVPVDSAPGVGLLKQFEDLSLKTNLAAAVGGVGLLLALICGVRRLRRVWTQSLAETNEAWGQTSERLKQTTDGLKETASALETQSRERALLEQQLHALQQDLERQVEERTATLSKTYATLEAELNSRKQAEKALAQQAQELGRSKDVLELHVQARTQELQKLQRRYEHILNSAGEGIYGLDLQGKTTFVNPAAAKLTGWKVEDLIGKSEQEVFHRIAPNGAPVSQTAFAARNTGHLTDQVFFRKDGSSFAVECVRTPLLEKEKLVGAVVIFKDITERKRTEETLARKAAELARSNAELEQFAYVASHDLQEPLRKIQAFGDRLKTKCDAAQMEEGRDYLERMQSAAARMQTLINDLLTFSRVISTTQPFVPVDLAAVTKEVLTDLEVRIEQTKAKVEVGPLPTIEADPLQMRQLLQNLVGNALKFQPANSHPLIKIHARTITSPFAPSADAAPTDEVCELVVEDNGIGFDEQYLDKIFAMFQRLHGRSEYEGTGVGLAVCRRITDRHGGVITAQSKPGAGATFITTLPVRQPTKELKAAA